MRRILPLTALLLILPAAALAAKTDVVFLRNGDRITCEIKKLEHGKLNISTDDMGKPQIEWAKIARLTSDRSVLVRTRKGNLFFGRLGESGQDGVILVVDGTSAVPLPMTEVAGFDAIKISFWEKIDLYLAIGFNWTKATSVAQFNLDSRADYRARYHQVGLSYNTIYSRQGDDDPYRRYDLNGNYGRVVTGKLSVVGSAGSQRNDELGLKQRLVGGGGAAYHLLERSNSSLATHLGVYVTREWATSGGQVENNVEGKVMATWTVFAYDTPKTDVRVRGEVMPSFTVSDRVRLELDVNARRELFKDFYLGLTYYESRDNKPPAGASAKQDRGLVFSLSWSK